MAKAATATFERRVLEVVEDLQALLWGCIEEGVRKLVTRLVERSQEAETKEWPGPPWMMVSRRVPDGPPADPPGRRSSGPLGTPR